MRLTDTDARARLAAHVHGVLCTMHPERGPDPLPVVYAVDGDGYLGVPIDSVKPKSSTRLRREVNLESDSRAALLVEHWDPDDWSRLWWVRAHLRHLAHAEPACVEDLSDRLRRAVPQYAGAPFHRLLVFRILAVSGWTAA